MDMKQYCIIFLEFKGEKAGDPAVIPVKTLVEGYNMLEIFDCGETATVAETARGDELRFFFEDTGYAIPADGETYGTQWHKTGSHPGGVRILVSLEDDIL